MEYKVISNSIEDTIELAENIESEKFKNMVIALEGDLGSGKTTFTKAFASALGIEDNITSPTFTLIKEYNQGEMDLYHMDVYRIEDKKEVLGLEEYFEKRGIVIVEWADQIQEQLPKQRLNITIKILGENKRLFIINPVGKKYEDLCEATL
ncbi:MAG: tRNA (adenosine(37)-N6)-threonylcarbamoyltransferase complex ATPase subunit type 1 TsaE [Bacilli bacterium]